MQNLPEKRIKCCGNGPKVVHLGQKTPFLGHFYTTGCISMTSFASTVVPSHVFHCDPPFVPLLPATGGLWGYLWPKMAFLAQNWPFLGHFHTIGCIFLANFVSRVVPPHMFHCDPPFVPLLPAMGGLMAKNGVFCPKLAIFGHFPCL